MTVSNGRRVRLSIDISPELREQVEAAAAARGLSTRKYIEDVLLTALQSEGKVERKLTLEERKRGLEVLERLEKMAREQLERRGGVPFPDSGELLNEARDQRIRELMNEA